MNVLKETTKVSYLRLFYEDVKIGLLKVLVRTGKFLVGIVATFGFFAIAFSLVGIPAFYLMNAEDGFKIENDEVPVKYESLIEYYQVNGFWKAQNFLAAMGCILSILLGVLGCIIYGIKRVIDKIRNYIRDLIRRSEEDCG